MAVSPSGAMSLNIDKVFDLLAACSTLQTWLGQAGEAAATKALIWTQYADEDATRPIVVVITDDGMFQNLQTAFLAWRGKWKVAVLLIDDVSSSYLTSTRGRDALYEFTNVIGAIKDELLLAGGATFVRFEINELRGPTRASRIDQKLGNDAYATVWLLNWG